VIDGGIMNQRTVSLASQEQQLLESETQESDLIFVGVILDIGPAPDGWSGYASSYQKVRYQIENIVKGQYASSEISILHVVVYESKTAQSGETPGLSTSIFYPGAKLIVSAQNAGSDKWKSLNEVIGAVPFSSDWMKRVEALVPANR
jgi:hypothetical protein